MVEVAILGFLKKTVAGKKAENSIERRLMSLGGSGEVFDGLRLAGLNKIGNAELGNSANRPAEGGTRHDAVEMFGFLLGHDFHLEYARTLSQAKTELQEFNCRVADQPGIPFRDAVFPHGLPHAFWYDPSPPESIEATHLMADFLRKELGK